MSHTTLSRITTASRRDTAFKPIIAVAPHIAGRPANSKEGLVVFRTPPREQVPPRIALIGDREVSNFSAILEHAALFPHAFSPVGLIVPGIDIDTRVIELLNRYFEPTAQMSMHAVDVPGTEQGSHDGFVTSERHDFSFMHCPYDAEALKKDPSYRSRFGAALAERIQSMSPELVLLSNFKVVLPAELLELPDIQFVNIHPSVLPILKGWRPEDRTANKGEFVNANGYTIHQVSKELDGGTTLFAQRVEIQPFSQEEESRVGKDFYARIREERNRLAIIRSQSLWAPQVLHFVLSETPRQIVRGAEAFAAEGRPGFEESSEFLSYQAEEYERACKAKSPFQGSFQDWQKVQPPYSRLLFDMGSGWQTLETILQAPSIVQPAASLDTTSRYSFFVHGSPEKTAALMQKLFARLRENPALKPDYYDFFYDSSHGGRLYISVIGAFDLAPFLKTLGIDSTVHAYPVGVTSPRRAAHES